MISRNAAMCLALAGCATCLCATASVDSGEEALHDLRESVAELRSSMTDFSVEFTFEAIHAGGSNAIAMDHRLVAIKNSNMIRMERQYSGFAPADGSDGAPSWFVAASYDGEQGCGYQQVNRLAYVRASGEIPLIDTEGSGFFDLMRYYPCSQARGEGIHARDLLSVLDASDATVRSNPEQVDGHACFVVDVGELSEGHPKESIWIDPERGYLPVVQQVFVNKPDGTAGLLLEHRIEQAVELEGGVWVPVRGSRKTFGFGLNPDTSVATEYEMQVTGNEDGSPLVSMNTGLLDSYFDYSTSLPAGTLVADLDTGDQWVASNSDYAAAADAVLASADISALLPVPHPDSSWIQSVLIESTPLRRTSWIILTLSALAIGCGLALRHIR